MSPKSFELSKEDPVVQQFISGLEAWERPFAPTSEVGTRGKVRTYGAVRTRGMLVHGTQATSFTLDNDDAVVQQFREGLEAWEHPFVSS